MGRSRASKDQMGFGGGVLPMPKLPFLDGGSIKCPPKKKTENAPLVKKMTHKGEKSH